MGAAAARAAPAYGQEGWRDVRVAAMIAAGVRSPFAPIGSNLPDLDNYFCRDCRRIVHVRKGSPGFRACPTQGCTRPTGFGVYATTPRPRTVGRVPAS